MAAESYIEFVAPAWAISALVIGALAADSLLRARGWRRAAEARENNPAQDER
jgi:heme exporter protein CcmD